MIKEGVYKHFKGTIYQVIGEAKHSETNEMLVIYQPLFTKNMVYARPKNMFCSKVDKEKYPDCEQEDRFRFIATLEDYKNMNASDI